MAGNRVEELEETVRELRATVSGLTDELVETKERLRVLEDEIEPDLDQDIIEGKTTMSSTDETDSKPEADETKSGEDGGENDADSEASDDIIVA